MPTTADKRNTLRQLHQSGCFVIPNPWDAGSARWLHGLGFAALATTSSGSAWSAGAADNHLKLDQALARIGAIVDATELPVNADFEAGFADDAEGVARNVRRCLDTGVAALSIEDASGDAAQPLYPLEQALQRLRAAREAMDGSGALLVGRAECFLTGHPQPLKEAIARLRAYAEAGADVLYAPGVRSAEDIAALVQAVAPKPLNVLAMAGMGLRVTDYAALGVRRVSVGGALARAAWSGLLQAAQQTARDGRFDWLEGATSGAELNRFFASYLQN